MTVRKTLVGLREAAGPGGETDATSVTFPLKPKLWTEMVELTEEPARKLTEVGLAMTRKSARTVTLTETVWTMMPLVPVTFTV